MGLLMRAAISRVRAYAVQGTVFFVFWYIRTRDLVRCTSEHSLLCKRVIRVLERVHSPLGLYLGLAHPN
jgi:hypothetical protein